LSGLLLDARRWAKDAGGDTPQDGRIDRGRIDLVRGTRPNPSLQLRAVRAEGRRLPDTVMDVVVTPRTERESRQVWTEWLAVVLGVKIDPSVAPTTGQTGRWSGQPTGRQLGREPAARLGSRCGQEPVI
jgi:hypothetical protein